MHMWKTEDRDLPNVGWRKGSSSEVRCSHSRQGLEAQTPYKKQPEASPQTKCKKQDVGIGFHDRAFALWILF